MDSKAPPKAGKVLLVDDDPICLQIVAMFLHAEGCVITTASSGEEALTLLLSRSAQPGSLPDLVLVDMQMPGMDGAELASRVRQLAPPRPRLIAMSATAPAHLPPEGFDSFLLKPVEMEPLRALLSMTLAPPRRRTEPAREGVLDEQVVGKLRAIMPAEALREIYNSYVTDTRSRIAELENCARRGDNEGLKRCAHMIKGSAAMAGVSGIVGIASALEAGIVAPENHGSLFHHLRSACDDVEQELAHTAPEKIQ